jgi:hypothetical protein
MMSVEQSVEWELESEKICPSAALSNRNPTWFDLGSNPGRCGGKPETNRLSCGTALDHIPNLNFFRMTDWRSFFNMENYDLFKQWQKKLQNLTCAEPTNFWALRNATALNSLFHTGTSSSVLWLLSRQPVELTATTSDTVWLKSRVLSIRLVDRYCNYTVLIHSRVDSCTCL